ncbi:MAG: hypothetical protein JRE20_11975 [Deltaproteobacteria bacterium]|nr:hypothetical protein [Deltaproteobacteria bacterium]
MTMQTLPEFCFEVLSKEVKLERMAGFENIENVKLASGEPGGGIKIYQGEDIKVSLVDFKLGKGVPIPHHENRLGVGAEIFQIAPDFIYKVPNWGINSIIMKDGTYYFDQDFSFGFDLVMDYEYAMKHLEPFTETYKKFFKNPTFTIVPLVDLTTWVRVYVSPVFFSALTTTDNLKEVYDLAAEYIKLWISLFRAAEKRDEAFKEAQQKRLQAQYAGMQQSDRMGKIILQVYGKETFSKFMKAMVS